MSYLVSGPNGAVVKHYLVKDSDTAGAKRTLADFLKVLICLLLPHDHLKGYREFYVLVLMQVDPASGQRVLRLVEKNFFLDKYYSKKTENTFVGYEEHVSMFD